MPYKVVAEERKQVKGLTVKSVPPSARYSAETKKDALVIKRKALKKYNKVKIVKL